MRPSVIKLSPRLKPAAGFSSLFHLGFRILLPLVVFVLVRLQFALPALLVILLSKWRIFAVRPRFWPANIRANAVDIMVGVSVVLFMVHTGSMALQLLFMLLYGAWLVFIKPSSSLLLISVQAAIGQLFALSALFIAWPGGPLYGLVAAAGLICYLSARHFFDSYNEPYAKMLSYLWGYFGAALLWVLGHWLLFYGVVAQPTLLLSAVGYGLAALYYLDHYDRLSKGLKRQFIFIMVAILVVVVAFSDWGDKIV